jgi:hypothetical protein
MNMYFSSRPCIVALLVVATSAHAQQEPRRFLARGKMRLTSSESLWTGRFSDCDYRYYVLIPNGFVAHANRPPRRLHGVLFGLPDTSTIDAVTIDHGRFISVMASSNELAFKSTKEFVDDVLEHLRKGKTGFRVKARQSSSLDGEPATKLTVEYDDPSGRVVEEELLSLRSGILYEIGLRSNPEHHDTDNQDFAKVVDGFRFWSNYRCYGTNNNP